MTINGEISCINNIYELNFRNGYNLIFCENRTHVEQRSRNSYVDGFYWQLKGFSGNSTNFNISRFICSDKFTICFMLYYVLLIATVLCRFCINMYCLDVPLTSFRNLLGSEQLELWEDVSTWVYFFCYNILSIYVMSS